MACLIKVGKVSLIAQSKESTCSAGDVSLIAWSGRSPGEGKGNPLQYSCLGNPLDRGAWWATVHRVTKESDTDLTKTVTTRQIS